MKIKVGINGFGRMGRLAFRVAYPWPDVEFVQINDPKADAATLAHLLNFDSVHGRWQHEATAEDGKIRLAGQTIACSQHTSIAQTDWSGPAKGVERAGSSPQLLDRYHSN